MTVGKDVSRNVLDQYDEIIATATTATFVNALTVNSIGIRESIFVIHNETAGDLDWEILANARTPSLITAPDGTNDDDEGWVVLKTGSIASGAVPVVESLSNPYTQVVVRIKHTTATTNVDIYHRGEQ